MRSYFLFLILFLNDVAHLPITLLLISLLILHLLINTILETEYILLIRSRFIFLASLGCGEHDFN